jgi:hypothetical protein
MEYHYGEVDLHRRGSKKLYLLESPLRALVHSSQEYILQKTTFCKPLPAPDTLLQWISAAWAKPLQVMEIQAQLQASCTRQVFNSHPRKLRADDRGHRLSEILALESLELTKKNNFR